MASPASTLAVQSTGDVSDGLFSQLTKSTGKNPIDSGLIRLITPTRGDPFMKKSAVLGQCKEQSFYNYAAGFPKPTDNWIEFDLRNLRVQVSAYSIPGSDRYVMQSWNLIGSNDHKTWTLIDLVRDAKITKDGNWRTFLCTRNSGPFRYVRYVQHANSERDEKCQYFIQISGMEFFGSVVEANQKVMQ
jgi:hypothetical protein